MWMKKHDVNLLLDEIKHLKEDYVELDVLSDRTMTSLELKLQETKEFLNAISKKYVKLCLERNSFKNTINMLRTDLTDTRLSLLTNKPEMTDEVVKGIIASVKAQL